MRPPLTMDFMVLIVCGVLVTWLITRLRWAKRDLDLAMREVQHRGQNMLSVVIAIVHHSLPGNREVAAEIASRIRTASMTDDLIATSTQGTVSLREIIYAKLKPFSPACTISGPEIRLSQSQARIMSLMIHELFTNAAKHGSLRDDSGRVDVNWSLAKGRCDLSWEESGTSPVCHPLKPGFGSELLAKLCWQLGADMKTRFNPYGIQIELKVPLGSGSNVVQGLYVPSTSPNSDMPRDVSGSPSS